MRIINRMSVKYDSTLFIISVQPKDASERLEIITYCEHNKLLYEVVKPPVSDDLLTAIRNRRNGSNISVVIRIAELQLTEFILHFG